MTVAVATQIQFGTFEPAEVLLWTPIPKVYSPPANVPGVYYTTVPIPDELANERMRFVVGRDGCVWKSICHTTGALYIWNNMESKCVEVWGYIDVVHEAASRVQARLELIKIAAGAQE